MSVASLPSAPGSTGPLPIAPSSHKDVPQGTDMLALAAAAHGQETAQTLIILAAIAAAIFWRALLKIALALVVILSVVLLSRGVSVFLHDLRLVLP